MAIDDLTIPPNNPQLEKYLIWYICIHHNVIEDDKLSEKLFFSKTNKLIFNCIRWLINRWLVIDSNLIADETGLNKELIEDIIYSLYSWDKQWLIKELQELAVARYIHDLLDKWAYKLYNNNAYDVKEFLEVNLDKIKWNKKEADISDFALEYFDNLDKINQYISSGYDNLDKLVWFKKWQLVVIAGRPWLWKDLSSSTVLPTPYWFTTMWEVKVWDYLLGSDWQPTKVLLKYNPNTKNVYKVYLSDWTTIDAWEWHLWEVISRKNRRQNKWFEVLSTIDMINNWVRIDKDNRCNYAIKKSKVEYEEKDLLIDPYLLWVWLWDWSRSSSNIWVKNGDDEIINNIDFIERKQNEWWCTKYSIKWLITKIKELWLYKNKYIPTEYLLSSRQQRLELLAWLLNTDWTVSISWNISFSTSIKSLSDNVYQLINSLWYIVHKQTRIPYYTYKWEKREWKREYRVSFTTNDRLFKLNRQNNKLNIFNRKNVLEYRYITDIKKIEKVEEYYCVQVDAPDKLFLCTKNFIRTHNTTVIQNIALRQSIKNKVVIISLEMTWVELIERFACMTTGHTTKEISLMESRSLITEKLWELLEKSLWIKDDIYSISEIEAFIRKRKMEVWLDVVYIDYLWLINWNKKSVFENLTEITKSLKRIAKKYDILLIIWSQLNREVEKRVDKEPQLADLRDSWSIEQDADIVIMLYREDYYDEFTENKWIMSLLVRKQRNGGNGKVDMKVDLSCFRLW
jgi:replicative DNA helicase